MKIDFYPKDESYITENIRKISNVIFILLSESYRETQGHEKLNTLNNLNNNLNKIENTVNIEIPTSFKGEYGEINILFINNKWVVLGGIGNHTDITESMIHILFNDIINNIKIHIDDGQVLMVYTICLDDILIESIKETMYELNGIYKSKQKTLQSKSKSAMDVFTHVFLPK